MKQMPLLRVKFCGNKNACFSNENALSMVWESEAAQRNTSQKTIWRETLTC